jgi:hypothetical protein
MSEAERVQAGFAYFSQSLSKMATFWVAMSKEQWTNAYDALKKALPDLQYQRVQQVDFRKRKLKKFLSVSTPDKV